MEYNSSRCKNGKKNKYPVGTEFECTYKSGSNTYEYTWIVVDNTRKCEWEDGSSHDCLWLAAKYTTDVILPFDAQEGIVVTESTAQAGVYYCGVSGSTYTMLNLNTGDPIPSGYDSILKGSKNHIGPYRDGYNRYKDSPIRQWLNSSEKYGAWWSAQHYGDNPPSTYNSINGFMYMLDNDFISVINPIKISTAANSQIDSGSTDVTYDKFFIPSLEEIYAVPQYQGIEGSYFEYFKTATGYDSPNNGSSTDVKSIRVIPKIGDPTNLRSVFLRSCSKGTCYNIWGLYNDGYISNNVSRHNKYVWPFCAIS